MLSGTGGSREALIAKHVQSQASLLSHFIPWTLTGAAFSNKWFCERTGKRIGNLFTNLSVISECLLFWEDYFSMLYVTKYSANGVIKKWMLKSMAVFPLFNKGHATGYLFAVSTKLFLCTVSLMVTCTLHVKWVVSPSEPWGGSWCHGLSCLSCHCCLIN